MNSRSRLLIAICYLWFSDRLWNLRAKHKKKVSQFLVAIRIAKHLINKNNVTSVVVANKFDWDTYMIFKTQVTQQPHTYRLIIRAKFLYTQLERLPNDLWLNLKLLLTFSLQFSKAGGILNSINSWLLQQLCSLIVWQNKNANS